MIKTVFLCAIGVFLLSACSVVKTIDVDPVVFKSLLTSEVGVRMAADSRLILSVAGFPGNPDPSYLHEFMTRPDGTVITLPSRSYLIAKEFKNKLESVSGIKLGSIPNEFVRLKKAVDKSYEGYVFEFATNVNYIGYKPLAWTTYNYMLYGYARLRDKNGEILWQQTCGVKNGKEKDLQWHESEFTNKLEGVYILAAKKCADQLFVKLGV